MSKLLLTIRSDSDKAVARNWLAAAPVGAVVEVREARRSSEQNNRMWAMLTEVAGQLDWHGQRLTPNDWKLLFLDALHREVRLVPALDGDGVVNLGRSSSALTKSEMTDLMELIAAFGANHGVNFADSAGMDSQQ